MRRWFPLCAAALLGLLIGTMHGASLPQAAITHSALAGIPAPQTTPSRAILSEFVGRDISVQIADHQIAFQGGTLRSTRGKLLKVEEGWLSIETDRLEKEFPVVCLPLNVVTGVYVAAEAPVNH